MRQLAVHGPLRRESDRRNHIRWSAAKINKLVQIVQAVQSLRFVEVVIEPKIARRIAAATYFGLTTAAASTCPTRRIFSPLLRRRKFFVDIGFFEFSRHRSDVFAGRPEVLEPFKVQRERSLNLPLVPIVPDVPIVPVPICFEPKLRKRSDNLSVPALSTRFARLAPG
jgi:hypothetical protein